MKRIGVACHDQSNFFSDTNQSPTTILGHDDSAAGSGHRLFACLAPAALHGDGPVDGFLLFALQSGLFGSALVHSQLTLTSVSKPPLAIRRRDRGAVIVMIGVTSRWPGRSRKRNRFVIGGEVVRRGRFAIVRSPLAGVITPKR